MDKPDALRLAEAMSFAFPGNLGIDKAAAELRRLHAERAAADGVINDLVAKVRELQKENESLAAALASSCDEQRHELWESGGIAGCERARVAERQRDVLLEALKWLDCWMSDKTMPECRWKVRGTIEAVEGENHAKSL